MNSSKLLSVTLAGVLQFVPLARVLVSIAPGVGVNYAIVSTWIAGALALMGSYDSVSGASTIINSAKTAKGTNGVAFSYRITTGPDVANTFAATPLPAGLTVGTTTGRITGTPTASGVTTVHLTASDNGQASRTVIADLVLTIVDAGTVVPPPTIVTQPANQTVITGANVSFSVSATGTAPLTHQWRRNGANVVGGTSSTLSLSSVTTNDAGNYTAVISNSGGSVTSSVATLTVNVPAVAPTITMPPASQTVTAGNNAAFSVTASGTAPLSYQWKFNGANIAGATSSTLSLTSVATNQAGNYTVVVTNIGGSATSGAATLTVTVPAVAPAITSPPASQTVIAGANVSFSVVASGTAPLSYQWRLNGANIPGSTSSTLSLTTVTTNQAGDYTVVVTNIGGSATSSAATLGVTVPAVAPTIVTPPANQSATVGDSTTFNVVASGTGPLSYQWRLNGSNIPGATSTTLTLSGVTTNQAGSYSVVVSNAVGSAASSAATLTVTALPIAPTIQTPPASQSVVVGANVTFSVVASGTGPLNYQWRLNGANISGAIAATLTLTGVTTNQAGSYALAITNIAGSVTSAVATLAVTVPIIAPSIVTPPANQSVTAGGNVSFNVVASGTGPLGYQWRFNGTDIPGAILSSLNLASVTTNQSGSYSVVVSNVAGTAGSTANLQVMPVVVINTAPGISAIVNQSVIAGSSPVPISFVIGDAESSASSLTLTKLSTNTALLPLAGIVFGGSGSNRTVTLSPQSGQTGNSLVTVTVGDGVATATSVFLLTVQPANTNPPTLLTLGTRGSGTITPNLGAQRLTLGKQYTLRATPATGFEFAGWSGNSNSPLPTLTFTMTSNLTFMADFVESPFIPAVGAYNGLFYESDAVRLASSGCFKLLVTPRGWYSGSIQFAGARHAIFGKLDLDCRATNVISRAGLANLIVEFALGKDSHVGEINGRISDGSFTANLSGARNDFNTATNPTTLAGRYTFSIAGQENDALLPAGDGFGTMRVSSNGLAKFAGVLADGTRVTCSAALTPDGAWPMFAGLYAGHGSVVSWFVFHSDVESDVNSSLTWIKEAMPLTRYYPGGFTYETKVTGSYYTYPIGSIATPILNLPSAQILFSGGDVIADFANPILISYYTKVSNLGTNTLKMTFLVANGTFSGSIQDPMTLVTKTFQGVALQKANSASGFMLGNSHSSHVLISAP